MLLTAELFSGLLESALDLTPPVGCLCEAEAWDRWDAEA